MRASDTDREQIAKILQQAVSEGRISMLELDERLAEVYAAKTLGDLEPIVADLPGVSVLPAPRPMAQPSVVHSAEARPTGPSELVGGTPGSAMSIAIMSGATRKGNWVVPSQHSSFALMGGVEIDLRNARFAEQHTTITAVALMGGIEIKVPDDVNLEVVGIGIMGGFEESSKGKVAHSAPPGAPTVKVNGFALMGGVDVKRLPRKRDTPGIEDQDRPRLED